MSISNILVPNDLSVYLGSSTPVTYKEQFINMSFTGPYTITADMTIKKLNNTIILSFGEIVAVAASATLLSSTTFLPVEYRPAQTYIILITVINNNASVAGVLQILNTGQMIFGFLNMTSGAQDPFTTAQACGARRNTVLYDVNNLF